MRMVVFGCSMEELCEVLGTKWGLNCKLFVQFALYVNM